MKTAQLSEEMMAFPEKMVFDFRSEIDELGHKAVSVWLVDADPNPFPQGPITLEDGRVQGFALPSALGDQLTDNSASEDGYRFHDALHIGLMVKTGWSAVMRKNLNIKRRDDPRVDAVEDGGRAIVAEESLFNGLNVAEVQEGVSPEDLFELSVAVSALQAFWDSKGLPEFSGLRPSTRQLYEGVLFGIHLFNMVAAHDGGRVAVDMNQRKADLEGAALGDYFETRFEQIMTYYDFIFGGPMSKDRAMEWAAKDAAYSERLLRGLVASNKTQGA